MLPKLLVSAFILFAVCYAAAKLGASPAHAKDSGNWLSIVPPVLAILLAFLTQHVILSLGIAFLTGALLTTVQWAPLDPGSWTDGIARIGHIAWHTITDTGNIKILCFIPPVFVMIETIIASGGFNGVLLWLAKWIRGKRTAQLQAAVLGVLCFIDDYANAIIVGSMMQPITDRFRISREKLAFIVDATSAPVSGLAIVSTWIAYEVGLFADLSAKLELSRTGYSMFFDALSFRFYCLFMLMFVFVNAAFGRDFGPMRKRQKLAEQNSDGAQRDTVVDLKVEGRAIYAVIPLAGFLLFHLTGLWFDGSGRQKLTSAGSLASWTYWQDVIGNAHNSTVILACAAVFGMVLALLCGFAGGALNLRTVRACVGRGVRRAMMPACVLLLAWSLKSCCDQLKTGEFLTTIVEGRISPLLFPAVLFIVASLTSFATGTSWGTMAILIPTAIPVAFALDGRTYGLTTMISLGAVLDGAIFGDHCSPISDTTIISSVSSGCPLMNHVRTQLPYSLVVAAMAILFGYLPAAIGASFLVSILSAFSATVIGFSLLRR